MITLSPGVTKALTVSGGLDTKTKMLLALNNKADRTRTQIASGVDPVTKAKRRAKGKVAKASRKINRGR